MHVPFLVKGLREILQRARCAGPFTIRRVGLQHPAERVSRGEPLFGQLAGRRRAYLDWKTVQVAKVDFEPLARTMCAVVGSPLEDLAQHGTLRGRFESLAILDAAAMSPSAGTGYGGWGSPGIETFRYDVHMVEPSPRIARRRTSAASLKTQG